MSVKLAPPTFTAPVCYEVPGDGAPIEVRFKAQFRRLGRTEREALNKRLAATGLRARLAATTAPELRAALEEGIAQLGEGADVITDAEICRRVLCGWQLLDIAGNAVAFDEQTVAGVFEDWPGIDTAIALAYFGAISPAAAEKNSAPPPAIG